MGKKSQEHLKQTLGFLDVFSIAAGAMISSGLFVLPGIAYAMTGPSMVLAYALAGLFMVPTMLAKAELATAMPKSGGSYFIVERSLGSLIGTFAGLANWFAILLKVAFALVGIGALAALVVPRMGLMGAKLAATAAGLSFGILNMVGTKDAGRFQIGLVAGLLAILTVFVVAGFPEMESSSFAPFAPRGLTPIFAVAGMVFVSFGGLTKVIDVAEEVRNPGRTIPLGMFSAFGVVLLLYVLVLTVVVGTVPPRSLAGSLTPINLSAARTLGTIGSAAISLAALLAFATTANAGIMSAARSPMAMSRDGLLPAFFARTSARFGTPVVAISITTAMVVLSILALPLETLVKTASTMMITVFVLENLALIVMRRSQFPAYRPTFRAPLAPWLQWGAIGLYGFLIVDMGTVPLLLTGAFALVGMAWYLGYVRPRIDRESAVIYLVRSIADKPIKRVGLEEELRELALRRDGQAMDRFGELVHRCPVLDLEGPMSAKQFFRAIAEAMAPRVDMAPEQLYERFLERERTSSTVVEPGLAIPHVVVEGEGVFEMALVRCRKGAIFSELHPPVHMAFVLLGSQDERNFHLRALMTIAHIVREEGFRERWDQARNAEQLRDTVLLAARSKGS